MFDIIVLSSAKMVNHVLDKTMKNTMGMSFHIITPFADTNTDPTVKMTITDNPSAAVENRVVLVITNDCYLPAFWEVQFLKMLQTDTTQVLVPTYTNPKYPEQSCPLFETFIHGIPQEKMDWYNRCSKSSVRKISNCKVDAGVFGYTTFVDTPLDEREWNVLQSCVIGNSTDVVKDANAELLEMA